MMELCAECSHHMRGWPWWVLQVAWRLASCGRPFTFSNVFVNHVTGIWQGPLFSDSKGVSSQQMVQSGLISDSSVESAL